MLNYNHAEEFNITGTLSVTSIGELLDEAYELRAVGIRLEDELKVCQEEVLELQEKLEKLEKYEEKLEDARRQLQKQLLGE